MLSIVEDWDIIAEYGETLGVYQLLSDGKSTEIRIRVGNLGYKKEFEDANNPLLIKILDFCQIRGYIQIYDCKSDEKFFM